MKNDDQKDDPIGSTRKIHRTLAYWAIVVLRGLSLFVAVASGILVLAYIAAGDVEFWPLLLFLISICLLCFWFGFRGHIARERLLILFGAASGIALGFFAFIGGILWAANQHPESNIAPVIAILFAGPLGFSVEIGRASCRERV